MIDFLNRWVVLFRERDNWLSKYKIYFLLRAVPRVLANIVLPIYYKCTANNSKHKLSTIFEDKKGPRVIVSLTSFPARIPTLWMVIESLLRQQAKPDIIILWLSKEQISDISLLPKRLLDQQKRGLKIEFRDGDLRSFKKFYYAMKEYPNDIVITFDDDTFYNTTVVKHLLDTQKNHPNCVIANHIHSLTYDLNGALKPYINWRDAADNNSSYNVQIGIGGVLYPPQILYKDLLREDIFMNICKKADDLWLFTMARLNNVKVIKTDLIPPFLPIIILNNKTLTKDNVNASQNDNQVYAIREYYENKIGVDPFRM